MHDWDFIQGEQLGWPSANERLVLAQNQRLRLIVIIVRV